MQTIAQQEIFTKSCEVFFGRRVLITPRASMAFLDTYRSYKLFKAHINITSDFNCFLGVVANSPACADILARNGVKLEGLLENVFINEHSLGKGISIINYNKMLNSIFTQDLPFSPGLNSIGEKVKETGIINELDLVVGTLESCRNRLMPNETGKKLLSLANISHDGLCDEHGDNFLYELETECKRISQIDVSHFDQQYVLFLDENGGFRIRPFGANSFGKLEKCNFNDRPFVFRGDSLQPLSSSMLYSVNLIDEFEDMINTSKCSEHDFQRFFEKNTQFLTGIDFKKAHPQPILYKDDGSKLIPDFFLEKVDSRWDAILDLKKPYDTMVARKKNRTYFKQWIQETISQLQYYREWFENSSNRKIFETTLNLSSQTFRPKMVIVAGRSQHFVNDVERMRLLSNQVGDLELWTYDDILSRARRYKQLFSTT